MSTSTKSNNKNTSTGTSRSGKKPSNKKVSTETSVPTEMVVSTPSVVVEKTIEVPADITISTEVVAATSNSASADAPVEAADTEPVPAPKPVVNIWELRKQARAADEALKKANEAIEKIAKEAEAVSKPKATPKPKATSESKPKATSESKPEVQSDEHAGDNAGWTKVNTKKNSGKPVSKYEPKSKPKTETEPKTETKTESKPKPSGKPAYKPKQPSEEEIARRELKNKALIKAQDQLIAECVGQVSHKTRDDINNSLPFIINYRRTVVVKFDDDAIVADVDGEKFEFSRTRFFENRIFQDKVREEFDSLIPMAWIRFFPGRDENTYCMGIMKRRADA